MARDGATASETVDSSGRPHLVEPEPPAAEPGGRRRIMLIVVGILVVLAAIWVVKKWTYGRSHETTDDAQLDGDVVPVLAKVGGYVKTVSVEENQIVKEGAPLVLLDDAEYRVKVAQADADLAAARAASGQGATTGQAEAAVSTAASQQGALQAQITAARANAQKADADLSRFEQLAKNQIVSQQQLDAARATAEAAHATVASLQRQASAAGAGVSSAEAGVRLANARLQAAQAARDNAALQLSYTKIAAPVAGIVSRKQVEPGQLVQPGQPLMSIVADTGVWVTANFKETQLSDLRVGQPAEIDVDAYKGCTAEGKVESLSAATGAKFALLPPDNATGNFTKVVQRVPVRIQITKGCGADRPLRPGMSVTASVKTG